MISAVMVFLLVFVLLLITGIPIAITLSGASLVYLMMKNIPPELLVTVTFNGMASVPHLAIPLFMLGGNLMNEIGLTKNLIEFARRTVGHIHGGVGMATVLACAIFAAISGSAVATAVAIGAVMIPAMLEFGYDKDVAAALTANSACMGPIIPPSISFILYGVSSGVSISALFIAGVVPGIMMGLGLAVYMFCIAKKRNYPLAERSSAKECLMATWKALPALFMPVLILGGILTGNFTPTEAAGVLVLYVLIVDLAIYRRLKLKNMPRILLRSGLESAVVQLLIGFSSTFAWVIAVEQMPQDILNVLTGITTSPVAIMLLVNICLLFLGTIMDTAPAIAIVTPILARMAIALGVDPIHMGVVVVFNLVLGLITPPVGTVLFTVSGTSKIPIERLSRAIVIPFLISITVLMLITYIPQLCLFLPNLVLR